MMKKIIFLFLVSLMFLSCNESKINSVSDVRKIKVGMSENEVKYLLGEPIDVEIDNGSEKWLFRYQTQYYRNSFKVTFVNNEVFDYLSY
jgi:outer membrane protein assembly factor BamE (lipoprotein component of BamABCDE complex)